MNSLQTCYLHQITGSDNLGHVSVKRKLPKTETVNDNIPLPETNTATLLAGTRKVRQEWTGHNKLFIRHCQSTCGGFAERRTTNACRSTPSKQKNICITFVQRRPTSKTLGRRCTNVMQMFCVYTPKQKTLDRRCTNVMQMFCVYWAKDLEFRSGKTPSASPRPGCSLLGVVLLIVPLFLVIVLIYIIPQQTWDAATTLAYCRADAGKVSVTFAPDLYTNFPARCLHGK